MLSSRTKRRYILLFVMISGIFIFLIGGASIFLLSENVLTILLVAYVLALIGIAYFMIKNIKTYRKFSLNLWRAQAHTPMSALTNKHCPRCNKLLYQTFFAEGGFPQMYVCKNCNYAGPIGLELTRISKKKIKRKSKKKSRKRKMS